MHVAFANLAFLLSIGGKHVPTNMQRVAHSALESRHSAFSDFGRQLFDLQRAGSGSATPLHEEKQQLGILNRNSCRLQSQIRW